MNPYLLVGSDPWAMSVPAFQAMLESVSIRAGMFDGEERADPKTRTAGNVGVIPIRGTIQHHAGSDFFSYLFGGTSLDSLSRSLDLMVAEPSIKSIILDIDSDGGSSLGLQEFAGKVRSSRGSKPILAIANAKANSAAYWIGTAADAFYATPSAIVGSVGVVTLHMDHSEMLANEGIKPTFIISGRYKVEGNPYEPLGDEAAAHLQKLNNDVYATFVGDVARNRGVSEATVKKDFGEGRVFTARDAKARNMIDGIATMDQVIKRSLSFKASAAAPADDGTDQAAEHTESADVEGINRLRRARFHSANALAAAISEDR